MHSMPELPKDYWRAEERAKMYKKLAGFYGLPMDRHMEMADLMEALSSGDITAEDAIDMLKEAFAISTLVAEQMMRDMLAEIALPKEQLSVHFEKARKVFVSLAL